MPSYTAQMGHWSEGLVDEVARMVGGSPDRRLLKDKLAQAGREIEVLSGRSFQPMRRATAVFEPNGLPFVDIPDLQVGSMEPESMVWEVPDPVNPRWQPSCRSRPWLPLSLRARNTIMIGVS